MRKSLAHLWIRVPVLSVLVTCLTLSPMGMQAFAQDEGAILVGSFVEKGSLTPLEGIQAVVMDITQNKTYVSAPSDATGTWSVEVPPGGRFQIVGMKKGDGPEQQVLNSPIRPVRVPGTYEYAPIVVEEVAPAAGATEAAAAAGAGAAAAAGAAEPETEQADPKQAKQEKKQQEAASGKKRPAWKHPGAIVGYVVAAVALVVILTDDDEEESSPSQP